MKNFVISFFVLLLSTNLAVAEEGVTDTEIHIAQFGSLTGPAKLWGGAVHGSRLVFRMVNEAGGIYGRKIVYHPIDDSYNPAKTKSSVKRMQEKEHIFAWVGGVGTTTSWTVKKYLTNRNIPWVGPVSGSDIWVNPPSRNIFALYPHYTLEARELSSYAVDKLKKERIAIVYLNDDYGKSGFKGAVEGLAKYNQKLVKAIPVQRNTSDMRTIAIQLRQAKADAVLLWGIPFQSLRIIMLSKEINYEPQWMAGSSFADTAILYRLSKGLIEGIIVSNYATFKNKALIEKYKEAHARLEDKDVEWSIYYHAGIMFAEVLVEGMKRCGQNLTRENLIKAMESIRNFEGMGYQVNFKSYNSDDPSCRQGINSIYLQQCMKGGKPKILTGWLSK